MPFSKDHSSNKRIGFEDRIAMGRAIPVTDRELQVRLAQAIAQLLETVPSEQGGRGNAKITATLGTGLDVAQISLDLSGYRVRDSVVLGEIHDPAHQGGSVRPAEIRNEPAQVATFTLRAHPVEVIGIPLYLDVAALKVPIAWVTDTAGDVWLTAPEDLGNQTQATFSGHFNLATAQVQVQELIASSLTNSKVTLRDLDLDVSQQGDRFTIEVLAKVRYGILSARFTAHAVVTFDTDSLTLTAQDIKVRSTNPVVAVALAAISKRITALNGQVFDINELLSLGNQRITALELILRGEELFLSGQIA